MNASGTIEQRLAEALSCFFDRPTDETVRGAARELFQIYFLDNVESSPGVLATPSRICIDETRLSKTVRVQFYDDAGQLYWEQQLRRGSQ